VAALSEQLIQVHRGLRERLASLRRDLADGTGHAAGAIPDDLLGHCLGFCAAIHAHHAGEDERLLPRLAAAAPELGPVIGHLIEDHALVSGILRRISELLAPGQGTEPGTLARELDGLTAILESHFGYEERRLSRALDELDPATSIADVLTRPGALDD
jgi:Hemerythrin HHE cation binding domain